MQLKQGGYDEKKPDWGTADPLTLYALWDAETSDEIQTSGNDKDFSALRTPGSQESAYEYASFFLPAMDGANQPYVGDPMPYYEDGVYYIYYLKDGGDSYNHSVYLATTTDFVTYTEIDAPFWSPPAAAARMRGLEPVPL